MTGGLEDRALVARVTERLAMAGEQPSATTVGAAVRLEGAVLGQPDVLALVGAVRAELVGLGPLEALLTDPEVTDVLVNGPDEVWVDAGDGLVRSEVCFADEAAVRRLAQRLAASAGRRLDLARPTVDARLPGGVRLHAVLPPVSPGGTLISLRVLRRRTFSLVELVERGTVPAGLDGVLVELVRRRVSFVVSGGTGSGKTTLLATLLSLVPTRERIVLVEDSGELAPRHPHVVRLEARQANAEGAGAVELRALVREAMRMRPDRVVVGEVRGPEVVELLAALNTGHDGGAGTVHASSSGSVPARLEALALAAGLPRAGLHSQLGAGVQAVLHVARRPDGTRRLAEVGCIARGADGLCRVRPALSVVEGRLVEGPGADALSALLGRPA